MRLNERWLSEEELIKNDQKMALRVKICSKMSKRGLSEEKLIKYDQKMALRVRTCLKTT